jgi:predicted glycoside hydrolase/deacetylase ChbG (UPF0249 family)/putative flippase GtrA
MNFKFLSARLSAYGLVGLVCAGVYTLTLLALERYLPTSLANPLAFLVSSLVGSLGHSRYTFYRETGGRYFAKRWIFTQYVTNLIACILLPLILPSYINESIRLLVLVFTPTVLNAFIWSSAARFSKQRGSFRSRPLLHADDLGLSNETNTAIFQLAEACKLDGASLLVNAPAAQHGVQLWTELEQRHPEIKLCLHLCLTEGPASAAPNLVVDLINTQSFLHYTFGKWLLLSIIPDKISYKRKIRKQISNEILAQIKVYKELTGKQEIYLDGHQHIHLVPIVLEEILKHAQSENITWIRSTREPLPSGLPFHYWMSALRESGYLKWILLQILSMIAIPRLRTHHVLTNRFFSGVFFTGQMSYYPLQACWKELTCRDVHQQDTASILLAHPGSPPAIDLGQLGFGISHDFASSERRTLELEAMKDLQSN